MRLRCPFRLYSGDHLTYPLSDTALRSLTSRVLMKYLFLPTWHRLAILAPEVSPLNFVAAHIKMGDLPALCDQVLVFIPLDRRLAKVVSTAATMITAPVEAWT